MDLKTYDFSFHSQDWVILGGTKYENNPNTDVWIGDKAAIINGVLELCPSLKVS